MKQNLDKSYCMQLFHSNPWVLDSRLGV